MNMSGSDTKTSESESAKNNTENNYERPSERMFRRSRKAQMQRRQQARKDAKFLRLIFGVAGLPLLLVMLFFFIYGMPAAAQTVVEGESPTVLTRPLIGPYSLIDLGGIAFVIIAGYAVLRQYKNRDK
jgi:hypothetical protein